MQNTKIKLLLSLAVIFIFICCINDNDERWNARDGVYSNFKYGYTIQLKNPNQWKKITGNALHTNVKFENQENGGIFFVNIQELGKTSSTIWDNYDTMKEVIKIKNSKEQQVLGQKVIGDNYEKVVFKGIKSIKYTCVTESKLTGIPEPIQITQVSYIFINRNCLFTVSGKIISPVLLKNPYFLDKLFDSFGLIPTRNEFN